MAKKRSLIQRLPLAPAVGAMFGTAAATLVAATPQWLFDATVAASGIGDVLSVAQPPLGMKARLLAMFVVFAFVATIGWLVGRAVEQLLAGPRAPKIVDDDEALDLAEFASALPPVMARRRPIFADRELGAPLMSDAALETAAPFTEPFPKFDPTLFEDTPPKDPMFDDVQVAETAEIPEAEIVAFESDVADDPVLQAPLAIEEFDLPVPPWEAEMLPGENSIDALIRRLEAGLARRAGPPPTPGAPAATPPAANPRDWMVRDPDAASFDEDTTRALGTLRRMAG